MPDFGSPPRQQRKQRVGPGRRAQKVRERMGPQAKLYRTDTRLIEEHSALEEIHRRRVHPGAQVHEASAPLGTTLDDGNGGFAVEPGRVHQVIVVQDAHHSRPFECCQRLIHGTADGIVEGDQSRRFTGAEHEMREPLGPLAKGPDRECLGDRHGGQYRRAYVLSVGCLVTYLRIRLPSAAGPFAAPITLALTPGTPMLARRTFIRTLAATAPVLSPGAVRQLIRAEQVATKGGAADDEAYWGEIQRAFDCDRTMVNLNNGGVSPAPTHVLEAMIRDLRFSNELPVDHMWRVLEPRVESVRRDLARDFGCDPEEMAITRNASESNETMTFGLDLKRGDEVIVTDQNYGRMMTAWDQRARRDGLVVKTIAFKVPPPSRRYVVDRFAEAITPRTRVIEATHITNLTGQILPVRDLVDLARPKGIAVFVDGAHAYAHFPFSRDDLDCDYYGTSLHKWLFAPIGTGFLYVRRDRIPGLWPLMAAPKEMDANIRKYEEIGTHPAANHNAIAVALAFHRSIGAGRKIARLRWLRDRWAKRLLADSDRVKVLTPLDSPDSGAIGLFAVEGLDPAKLNGWLWEKHRIITTLIVHKDFSGLRITPSVHTTPDEVDLFSDRVLSAVRQGLA